MGENKPFSSNKRQYLENDIGEIRPNLLFVTNRKFHIRLAPRSMTLDDLELLQVRIVGEFRGISHTWESINAKRMKTAL